MSHNDPPIDQCRNLGPRTREMLEPLQIRRLSDLRKWGSVGVYLRVKDAGHRPSLNLLYALEGALTDRDWREITLEEKAALQARVGFET